jgi:hypothetical protein
VLERRGSGVGTRADAKHLLRAFVALCEIHWRSFWLWRGGVLARYGRGPTPNPVEGNLGAVSAMPTPSPSRLREGNFGVASPLAIFAPAPKAI